MHGDRMDVTLPGRPRRRWEDNSYVDLKDIEWGHGMD